jgi:ankyrin repeat protein
MVKSLKRDASQEAKAIATLLCEKSGDGVDKNEKFREEYCLTPIHSCVLGFYNRKTPAPDLSELLTLFEQAGITDASKAYWRGRRAEFAGRSHLYMEALDMLEDLAVDWKTNNSVSPRAIIDMQDAHGWTALDWAGYTGRLDEMRILMSHGANPISLTASDRNVLHQAAESGSEEMMRFLVEHDGVQAARRVDQQDLWKETPLHIAATQTAGSVRQILRLNPDVRLLQEDGRTALHESFQATSRERRAIVDLLCDHDPALMHQRDDAGRTPMFDLIRDVECISSLLERGANTDVVDRLGRSLLHEACRSASAQSLKVLLPHFTPHQITGEDSNGSTALVEAFAALSESCVMQLFHLHDVRYPPNVGGGPESSSSADPAAKPRPENEWTILHHAARFGSQKVLEYVLKGPRWRVVDFWASRTTSSAVIQIARDHHHYYGEFRVLLDWFAQEEGMSKFPGTV